ncbi:MAG: Planctomycete cytochrome [Phycisphaerales bacterium]|nr:Planctomycete cytochrome [Phycisphaerales bacterium]
MPRLENSFSRVAALVALGLLFAGQFLRPVYAESQPTPAQSPAPYDWHKWKQFWSFRPLQKPDVPVVKDAKWVRNPIDAFVLAHLEAKGLHPAPEADKATLFRRLTYDLTGLPPTPAELRAFLADASPDAYEKQVDRLLASPHYGEKWGRHWLDVARYTPGRVTFPGVKHTAGDSHYRDYVVRAFNTDKPYDRFITEQLAGDLLPPSQDRQQEYDQIAAPAFLSIGPWFDQCTDPNRLRLEMVDDMINATSKAFLGLSVSCARCHDHKFDPIPTADYYALAGVFGSTRIVGDFSEYWRDGRVRLLRPMAMPDEVAANQRVREQIDAKKAEQWKQLTTFHSKLLSEWKADEARYRAATAKAPLAFVKNFEAEDFDGIYNLRIAELARGGKVVQIIETLNPTQQWVKYRVEVPQDGQYRLEALYTADEKSPVSLQANGATVADETLNNSTGGWDLQYQRWETLATFDLRAGLNFLRLNRKEGNFPRIDKFRLYRINDGYDAKIQKLAAEEKLHPEVLAGFAKDADHPWPTVAGIIAYLDADQRKTINATEAEMAELTAKLKPHALIVAVNDQPKPADMPVHVRGSIETNSTDLIPRGTLRIFDDQIPRPAISPNNSGRLELARWITSPHNPLTTRVLANRIWQWHFGRGIVDTPSDFGSRGSAPTHPELLDWLASTLQEGDWSIKKLHRLILLSSAYRMSSQSDERAMQVDPDNHDLSHFSPRRLEAEELFDSMLSSTNVFVRQESGKPLELEKSKGRALYVLTSGRSPPGLGPEVRKMFSLFDYDMAGASIDKRPISNTASQSLFWLNSPLPKYYADKFADRLLKMDKLTDEKRLEQAYLIAIGHKPSPEISMATLEFLNGLTTQGVTAKQAWAQVCQAIYASNEFHSVE